MCFLNVTTVQGKKIRKPGTAALELHLGMEKTNGSCGGELRSTKRVVVVPSSFGSECD